MDVGKRNGITTRLACSVFGHRHTFWSQDVTMEWECSRCGGERGSKDYPSAEQARRFSAAFDQRDTDDLGRRAPLIGLLPLRWWYRLRGGRR